MPGTRRLVEVICACPPLFATPVNCATPADAHVCRAPSKYQRLVHQSALRGAWLAVGPVAKLRPNDASIDKRPIGAIRRAENGAADIEEGVCAEIERACDECVGYWEEKRTTTSGSECSARAAHGRCVIHFAVPYGTVGAHVISARIAASHVEEYYRDADAAASIVHRSSDVEDQRRGARTKDRGGPRGARSLVVVKFNAPLIAPRHVNVNVNLDPLGHRYTTRHK